MSEEPYSRLRDGEEFEIEAVRESRVDMASRNGELMRRVDYVLVYETTEDESRGEESVAEEERWALARTYFEKQLERKGLLLEQRASVVQVFENIIEI